METLRFSISTTALVSATGGGIAMTSNQKIGPIVNELSML